MDKRRVEWRSEVGEGLTHNPFAGLRGGTPEGRASVEPHPVVEPQVEGALGDRLSGSDWLVRKERKGRGGKVVTIVSPRAEGVGLPLGEVARRLGQKLGTGARAKGGQIVVQGELADRVRALLEADGARVTLGS
jgi:translation initiation factor 1 (eIF-1/SUI1)